MTDIDKLIQDAYKRGAIWATENAIVFDGPDGQRLLDKAAYDYADKTLSSTQEANTMQSEIVEKCVKSAMLSVIKEHPIGHWNDDQVEKVARRAITEATLSAQVQDVATKKRNVEAPVINYADLRQRAHTYAVVHREIGHSIPYDEDFATRETWMAKCYRDGFFDGVMQAISNAPAKQEGNSDE